MEDQNGLIYSKPGTKSMQSQSQLKLLLNFYSTIICKIL